MTGSQSGYRVRFERGESGLRAVAGDCSIIVVVDVLSFSTAIDVAVASGSHVRAMRPLDDVDGAARRLGAFRAVSRSACSPEYPYSLSPDSLVHLPPGSRLILPSPNGASLIAAASEFSNAAIIAGCLRNATAIGSFINTRGPDEVVAIISAGERWPDGSLRPALEDDLGVGAIVACLDLRSASPEAKVAASTFVDGRLHVSDNIRASATGVELFAAGFSHDVERALEIDCSLAIPILQPDGFLSAFELKSG